MSDNLYLVSVEVNKTYYMYVRAESKDEAIDGGYELFYDLEPHYEFIDVNAVKEINEPIDRYPIWAGGPEGSWE